MNKGALPILYSFRRCPYAIRARFALIGAGIAYEHREISLKNKPREMLIISPKGTVPVLVLSETQVLDQSLDIMAFALGMPSEHHRALIDENDTSFKHALDRYKYPGRFLEDQAVDYRDSCLLFINKLENCLSPFLSGAKPALVDMALFPFVRQFARVDPTWFAQQNFPHLKQWLDFFISSDLFEKVMQKYPLWTSEKASFSQ